MGRCKPFSNTQRRTSLPELFGKIWRGQEEGNKVYAILMMAGHTHPNDGNTIYLNEAKEMEADQSDKK